MRAAIIDDLETCRRDLQRCLRQYLSEHYAGETPAVEEFSSGEDFLSEFQPEAWDVIFIDQYMTGLSGIDTARKIRERDKLAALVFVTTSVSHAVESYGVRASGYLVKPYDYGDFEKTMELCGVEKIRSARFVRVEQEKVLLREILWCDKDEHYTQIHTDRRGVLRFRLPFGELSGLLAPYPQFLPCYKGCIVNAERVERIDALAFRMDNGAGVPFARREKKKLEGLYSSYLFQREREDALL